MQAEQSAQEGYRRAESIGSLQDMSAALDALAGLYEEVADFPKSLEATQRRVQIVEQLNDPLERADLHRMLAIGYEHLGDFREGLTHSEQSYRLASTSAPYLYHNVSIVDAVRSCWKWNRWDEAERWCRLADQITAQPVRPGLRRTTAAFRAFAAGVRGDVEETRRRQGEFEAVSGGDPALAWVAALLRWFIAWALDDRVNARTFADDALRLANTPQAKLEVRSNVLQFAAEAGEWQYVDTLSDETLESARRSGGRDCDALTCRALGIHRREHGRYDQAAALLTEAVDLFRALDCPWDLGKALRDLAILRRAHGRADEAIPLLQEALTNFENLRALPDIERTRALM